MDIAGKAIHEMTREELLWGIETQRLAISGAKAAMHESPEIASVLRYHRFIQACEDRRHEMVEHLALLERMAAA